MSLAFAEEIQGGPGVYLRSFLAPLTGMLARPDVTDIYVNRPGEIWVETTGGGIERHEAPGLDPSWSSTERRGDALLAAPAAGVDVQGGSFA